MQKRRGGGLLVLLILAACASPPPVDQREGWIPRDPRPSMAEVLRVSEEEVEEFLHLESPDWRDQVIYFIMPDRFDDGDRTNSDQGAGEYDPTRNSHYSGGDLQGIVNNLDYIKALGMTSLWITPPVANQWYDFSVNYGGYHGYWAEHLMEVDKHMGTLETYKRLSATLHKNGMYLIQDIVPNHMGNFFTYTGPRSAKDPKVNYLANSHYVPREAPRQFPFNLNDPADPKALEMNPYHWTGPITNYQNQTQLKKYQLSDLDDINTESPFMRDVLRESYGYWIKEVGVDGFRIDTVKYVDQDFWHDFHHKEGGDYPGIFPLARSLGKENFITFGEAWISSVPYEEKADREMASYIGSPEKPGMSSVLNFSLNQEIRDVFAGGKPTAQLGYRWESLYRNYPDPSMLFNFIDNHDMDRFRAIAEDQDMALALGYLFTVPGIPIVYYGTEQGFTETRAALFANGFASGGRDHFKGDHRFFQEIQELSQLRKSSRAFTHGVYTTYGENPAGAGIMAYGLDYQGEERLVLMNTSEAPALGALEDLPWDNQSLQVIYSSYEGEEQFLVREGFLGIKLPPKSFMVLQPGDRERRGFSMGRMELNLPEENFFRNNFILSGQQSGLTQGQIVIDGNLHQVQPVGDNPNWEVPVNVESLSNGPHFLQVIGYTEAGDLVVSSRFDFQVELAFSRVADIVDPLGDDKGPKGGYEYPTDPSFTNQMDIAAVSAETAGRNLKINIDMAGPLSTSWNPVNGFDHVCFYIYVDSPYLEGASDMPFQNSRVPQGMDWDRLLQAGGWNNSLYGSSGAGPESYGTSLSSSAVIEVNDKRVSFVLDGASLGNPESLKGFKIYVSTWDYDGLESANRQLSPEADDYIFGGGDYGIDPLIMDDTEIIIIP